MILREIVLGETEESKKKAIENNLGKEVILNDFHETFCHGILLSEGYDNKCYQMQIADGRGKRQLHYHDLNQLLLIVEHSKYKRSEI